MSRTAGESPGAITLRASAYWDWVGLSEADEAALANPETPRLKRVR